MRATVKGLRSQAKMNKKYDREVFTRCKVPEHSFTWSQRVLHFIDNVNLSENRSKLRYRFLRNQLSFSKNSQFEDI